MTMSMVTEIFPFLGYLSPFWTMESCRS